MDKEKNRDVILNFGLIARGKLREIERLQDFIIRNLPNFRVIYQTVTARKLKLLKIRGDKRDEWKGGRIQA